MRITTSSALPSSWLFGIDSHAVTPVPREEEVVLQRFLGSQLVTALGRLTSANILGPWPGWLPVERRQPAQFSPALYGEDHAHGHAELCLLLDGQCLFSFNRRACLLERGDIVICPAGIPHAEAFVQPAGGYQLAWWSLHPTEPNLHVTRYSYSGGFAIEHGISLDTRSAETQERLTLLRAIAQGEPPAVDRLREAMLTLSLLLFRRVLAAGGQEMDTRTQLVRRAIDYVRHNAERPLTLSDVARAVRVSPNYLTGLFSTQNGLSLGRFIIEERLAAAKVRLRQPGASVKGVALEMGFSDQYTFSKAFKRVTGLAPRVWQARQLAPASE